MSVFKFQQGDIVKVKFQHDGVIRRAKICGSHHTGLPTLGIGYIIEPLGEFADKEVYPFTHTVCFESDIIEKL